MKQRQLVTCFSSAVTCLLVIAPPLARQACAAPQSSGEGWRTTIYPIYAWLPIFGADVKLPEVCNDCGGEPILPGGSVSSSFDGAALSAVMVEYKWFQADASFLWAGLSASKENPFLEVRADTVLGSARAGVRVLPSVFVNAGVRRVAVNLRASAFDFPEVQWKPGVWEELVGVTLTPRLSSKLRLIARADYGGFLNDAHSTFAANGSLEWEPVSHLVVTMGYGVFDFDVDGTLLTKPISFGQTLHGPIFGIGFTF